MSRFLVVSFFCFLSFTARAQEDFPHQELDWQTIETQHFLVHYHDGESRTGHEVAKIAEEIYGPITTMYRHQPDQKVSIVLRDHDDFSNGAAYFYDNKIEIWAPSLDFELRGTHPWLRNVVSHEFTHIVEIQTAMKFGRSVPGLYLQWLGYEAERRPDVLYGYPNVIVSYPYSGFLIPSWFAEGVAQFNNPILQYDRWDTHRDMILRMYMLEGTPLSWEEMAVFGKTSLGNESSYNAGFSIVGYIAKTYGLDKLRQISIKLSTLSRVTIDGAIEASIGKSGLALYEEWKGASEERYRKQEASMGKRAEGAVVDSEGFGNFYPQFSPDGSKLAYVSNKGSDFFSGSSIYILDRATGKSEQIAAKIRSSLSFSPDGKYIYFSRSTRDNPHWSGFFDIYRLDLATREETRLTHALRAMNPKVSHDGSRIVFAYGSDGTLNIGVCDSNGANVRALTKFGNGEQVFTPAWSPDDRSIVFGYSDGQNQSVATVNEDGSGFRILVSDHDARNPVFSPDGKALYYSSDRTGIFNIYRREMATGEEVQVTNVLGGAFLPTVDADGNVAFASYRSSGYKIALIKPAEMPSSRVPVVSMRSDANADSTGVGAAVNSPGAGTGLLPSADHSADEKPAPAARPYRSVFTSLSLIPFIRFDNYNPHNTGLDNLKPGLYVDSNEMLDKMSLFAGGAMNRRWERDLFLIFEYRDRIPLLYQLGLEPITSLELYNITRVTNVSFPIFTDKLHTVETDVTYDLLEFDLSFRQKVFVPTVELQAGYTLSRYNADLGSFFLPAVGTQPAFSNLYLIGNVFSVQLTHNGILPSVDEEINPVGRTVMFRYSYELNQYNKNGDFDIVNGALVPHYTDYDFHRLELVWNEHLALPFPKQTLTLSVRRGTIPGQGADTIFHFYAGGLIGMRGYPYYAIDGNDVATASATYRFPLWTDINFRVLEFYFTKLYGSFFGDVGDAWTGPTPPLDRWRKDAGFELRLESFSFYSYPTRFFFSGAYGFDRFTESINSVNVTYGREWRFYFGILFDFEITEFSRRGAMR